MNSAPGQRLAEAGTQPALGFQHQYTEPGSGNVNMGARWYQPDTGTFASRDTAGLDPRDLNNSNRYAYASADPLANGDPSGHFSCRGGFTWGGRGLGGLAGSYIGGPFGSRVGSAFGGWLGGGLASWICDTPAPQSSSYDPSRDPHYYEVDTNLVDEVAWLVHRTTPKRKIPSPRGGSPGSPDIWMPLGGGIGVAVGGGVAAAKAAAQAAYQAWLQARRQRVIDDVNTPHARPPKTDTIVDSIRKAIDAAKRTIIDLGVIHPEGGEPTPYEPETNHGIDQPGPLPPATAHLEDSCADGARPKTDGSRSAQVWACGTGANAANHAKFLEQLKVAELANPLIDYLRETGKLPPNYVTKEKAEAAGWRPGKSIGHYIQGAQIGGDPFKNLDGKLPVASGRLWYEADVGLSSRIGRNKQPGWRLLCSSDGLAYVTIDHYESFYRISNWR
ncbi:RHS repeat-associated core domain protein [Saccharomonospora azurea NA-128]|uniref:Ribonuclease n=1 Tax=Saccharomonospora azurea NA-128 TaxID=882081 RepID=H8G750_9PSEU|nr:RHS repeat-associated core domain protein [Saccharomonospora azurea NA-128]